MKINYNVTGAERKRLAQFVSETTGAAPNYLGAPTFAYQVDYFHISKDGTLEFDDRADSAEVERLIEALSRAGFEAESNTEEQTITSGTIFMPKTLFTETSFENLKKLIAAKERLIKTAFGLSEVTLSEDDENIGFPWIPLEPTEDEINACTHFVSSICEMAKTQKRVTAKEGDVENEKYAFRCFLLRLGYIGSEYKWLRKTLLKNFEGNGAFKMPKEDSHE